MDNILEELELFRKQLQEYYSYRQEVIIEGKKLTKQRLTRANKLHDELAIRAGNYGNLIADLTGIEPVISTSSGQSNIWTWALSYSATTLVVHALDQVLQATSLALGNIQRDINLGIRDQQGNVIRQLRGISGEPPKAFISHSKESVALSKLEEFLRTLGVEPLIVKEQPSLDKTVDDKVNYYLSQADFVVILATGDDEINGKMHPRQNVIHEIGLAQQTHEGKIIYLLEERAQFPSNISPKVWERFKQRNMIKAFLCIVRELRAYDMLKVLKPQE